MADDAGLGPTGGAVWSRPDEWAQRRTPQGCVVCQAGQPLDVVAELPSSWISVPPEAAVPGYVCVIARQHVNEPFEMDAANQAQFWQDSMLVAEAVASVVHPIKMNYEIHGNTPHSLHLHLFPRQANDPFVGGPIDPRRASVRRSPNEIEAIRDAIEARTKRRSAPR